MPLDEKASRKPGFIEGSRVTLGDGQSWSIPRPRVQYVPRRGDDGVIGLGRRVVLPRHQPIIDAMLEAEAGGDDAVGDWLTARTRLAVSLLLDNYDLSDDALVELLPLEIGDDANADMWRDLTAALRGDSVKA